MASLKDITELLKNAKVKSTDKKSAIEVYEEFKNILPFPIVQFAHRFGVKVFSTNLGPETFGMIKGKEILINSNDNQRRQIFTTAHELAHYLLGHGDKEDYVFRKKSYDTSEERKKEREANELAAELLMPAKQMMQSIEALSKTNDSVATRITELALKFGVSEIAMSVRLDRLGYYNGGYYC